MPQHTLPRSPGIDLLRGFSILLVVVHHLGLRIPLHKTDAGIIFPAFLLKGLIYNGYEAVFLFFVVSGFLITRHVLERDGALARIDWRAFYARRVARIGPCLLGLVAVLLVCHAIGVPHYVIDKPGQSPLGATLSALTFTLNVYEGRTDWLPGGWDVLWSLSVEEVFYLAFPIVCLTLGRTRWLVPALLVLVVSVPFTRFGMPRPRTRIALVAAGLAAIALVMFSGGWLWRAVHEGYMLVLVGAAVAFVVASPEGGMPLAGLGWLRAMGRASYEVYLTHMFVVFSLVGLARITGTDKAWGWVWYVPAVLLAWALGQAVATFLSDPANRWLRRRLLPPAPATAPAA